MSEYREMPSSEEAEVAIIASILFDSSLIEKVTAWLRTDKPFWYNFNGKIYKTILKMHRENKPIDYSTVAHELKETYGPDFEIFKFLSTFGPDKASSEAVPESRVEYFAIVIYEKFLQRRYIEKAKKIDAKAYKSPEEFEEMLEEQGKIIEEIRALKPSQLETTDIIVDKTIAHIKEKDNIIKFGIRELDDAAGGMTRREISVLGGRPSHGKSTVAMNIAISLIERGYKVMIFNREMTNIEMMKKIIVHQSSLEYQRVRRNELTSGENEELFQTTNKIKSWENLYMFDNIRDLTGSSREIKRYKPDVVIDDHIGLIKPLRENQKRHEIGEIMEEYKWIAKYQNCHVLVVSQLNRELEKRIFDPRPKMSDYAESGVIEQLAELCMFSFRGYVLDHENYDKYELELIIAKARYGDINTYPVGFDGNACKLYPTMEEAKANRR